MVIYWLSTWSAITIMKKDTETKTSTTGKNIPSRYDVDLFSSNLQSIKKERLVCYVSRKYFNRLQMPIITISFAFLLLLPVQKRKPS